MLFYLAAAALQPFVTLAAPSVTEPLSVPVSDITKRDLSGHEEHPYFGVYQRWLESPVGSNIRRDTDAFLEQHPNLVSIECRADNDNCLLVSTASLPPRFASALAEPSVEKRGWANAHNLFVSTHLKTYEGNDEDDEDEHPPMGHEHYLDANMRISHLPGDTLVVNVKHTGDARIRTQLSIDDKGGFFDRDSTCECVDAHSVNEQECKDFSGGGWCGVHVTQYQKNQGPGMSPEHYRFTVNIRDTEGKPIGEHDLVPIPSREEREFGSLLPEPFKIYAHDIDSDAIWMHYKDQHFTSNDQAHHCDFGQYDNGYREGDCGVTC